MLSVIVSRFSNNCGEVRFDSNLTCLFIFVDF